MKLIVGLGNAGERYAHTRHNLGFKIIDQLIERFDLPAASDSKFHAMISEGTIDHQKVMLAKPTTMMNLSGQAILKLQSFYKIEPDDVWVIYDDFELPFGSLRSRQGGSSGGHNGIRSIIDVLGEQVARFRVGIANDSLRHPIPADKFVLASFDPAEITQLPAIIQGTAAAVVAALNHNQVADTTINLLDQK